MCLICFGRQKDLNIPGPPQYHLLHRALRPPALRAVMWKMKMRMSDTMRKKRLNGIG
jgi:hypothetical protein